MCLATFSDDKGKPAHVRFLVSNAEAGSIIGKGGTTITEFQSQSGARIQLSRNHEFFPGTSDRIIMITGAFSEILKAMELILAKLLSEVVFLFSFSVLFVCEYNTIFVGCKLFLFFLVLGRDQLKMVMISIQDQKLG